MICIGIVLNASYNCLNGRTFGGLVCNGSSGVTIIVIKIDTLHNTADTIRINYEDKLLLVKTGVVFEFKTSNYVDYDTAETSIDTTDI